MSVSKRMHVRMCVRLHVRMYVRLYVRLYERLLVSVCFHQVQGWLAIITLYFFGNPSLQRFTANQTTGNAC